MSFAYFDRIAEASASSGTGNIALAGAVTGYRTFGSVYSVNDTFYYVIQDQSGGNWEVGSGTYSATNTLRRDTVLASSNAGSLVNFTSGALFAFVDVPAAAIVTYRGRAEVPSGAINSSNTTFTLAHTPSSPESLKITVDRLLASYGVDYTLSGNTVTMAWAPATGSEMFSYYDDSSAGSGSTGTVTSVTFTGDGTVFSSTPSSAVTTTGTLPAVLNTQSANKILAGPATGSAAAPTFRFLVVADLPAIAESVITFTDITANNVTSTEHGYAPKSPGDATKFLNGAAIPGYAAVKDSDLSLTDITTNNASTSAHGFVPKLPNDSTKFYNGVGGYSVPAGGGSSTYDIFYGNGQDGALSISSGTTTLTRDMFYTNITISGTASINLSGFRLFWNNILDITAAPAGAIVVSAVVGTAASGVTGGTANAGTNTTTNVTVGNGQSGQGGANGQTTTGTNGQNGNAGILSGGLGNAAGSGAGGNGSSGNGGSAGGTLQTQTTAPTLSYNFSTSNVVGVTMPLGGQGGTRGGSGGGDGTAGGGSGGGGQGGGIIIMGGKTIARGTNTTAGIIQAIGGTGGVGGTPAGGARGGGAGGTGGGGGYVRIIYDTLTGSTITNAIDVTGGGGGAGGNGLGGNGTTTGTGGDSGSAGSGGIVHLCNRTTGVITEYNSANSVAYNAHSGRTGGTAVTATVSQVSL